MSENPYAIPVEELIAGAKVDAAAQIEEQAGPRTVAPDWSPGVGPCADGMSGDVDGP